MIFLKVQNCYNTSILYDKTVVDHKGKTNKQKEKKRQCVRHCQHLHELYKTFIK